MDREWLWCHCWVCLFCEECQKDLLLDLLSLFEPLFTEADSDIPVHVRVHVHEGKISGRGLRYQGVVRVWSQDGGS